MPLFFVLRRKHSRMRIGIDARMAYYTQAGIGQYIRRLIEGLAKIHPQEELVLLQSRKDEALIRQGRFRRRSLWTPSHHRLEQWLLPLEIAMAGLDILHSPDFIPPFRRNCRSVITIHDLAFLLYPHFLTRESARYYGQIDQAVRRTDHIIAVSESTKRDTVSLLGVSEKKITVIHEAANPLFRPVEDPEPLRRVRDKYGLPEAFILFVSTIEPRKNLPTLLRAFRLLLNQHGPLAKLAVVGKQGWLFEEVHATVEELNLGQDVLFLGRVPSEDLVLLYNAARLHVHPSYYEGFGLPPLEAMICGTPTIVSNVASLPEVVGDAGLLVDPNDVEGWAAAIRRLLADPHLRQEMREKGFQQAQRFSLERMAQETLAVYRRVGRK
ncbi:MAG TPA: glycosyltransferase family 1 protein [Anaerolineae bacterium]|nr:glycosyltransferase family 1 protein [Anaerolineae bacterium]